MPGANDHTRAPLGVVLNAGLGTRLRPVTPALPKALVPVMNRPLIDYSISYLAALGVSEIALVVSPGDDATEARAREVAPPGLAIHVAVQEEAHGIGHAVTCVGALLDDRVVAVLAADTLLIGDCGAYLEEFAASEACAGLLLAPVEDPRAFGVAILDGARVVDLEEKPHQPRSDLALVGLWLLGPAAIERVRANPVVNAKGESDLTATIARLLEEGHEVRGWPVAGEWLDAGTVEGLLAAHERLLLELEPAGDPKLGPDATVRGVLAAHEGASASASRILGPVLLGRNVEVHDSEVHASVLCDGVSVRGARLERCLVLPGARIEGGSYREVVITAAGEVAGPGAKARARGPASLAAAGDGAGGS